LKGVSNYDYPFACFSLHREVVAKTIKILYILSVKVVVVMFACGVFGTPAPRRRHYFFFFRFLGALVLLLGFTRQSYSPDNLLNLLLITHLAWGTG
jgi:hypothetical protein